MTTNVNEPTRHAYEAILVSTIMHKLRELLLEGETINQFEQNGEQHFYFNDQRGDRYAICLRVRETAVVPGNNE